MSFWHEPCPRQKKWREDFSDKKIVKILAGTQFRLPKNWWERLFRSEPESELEKTGAKKGLETGIPWNSAEFWLESTTKARSKLWCLTGHSVQNDYSTTQLNVMGCRGNVLRAQFCLDKISNQQERGLAATHMHGKKFLVNGGDLSWECQRHVGNMSPTHDNVAIFGRQGPDMRMLSAFHLLFPCIFVSGKWPTYPSFAKVLNYLQY